MQADSDTHINNNKNHCLIRNKLFLVFFFLICNKVTKINKQWADTKKPGGFVY
jgi:hypothetical protein